MNSPLGYYGVVSYPMLQKWKIIIFIWFSFLIHSLISWTVWFTLKCSDANPLWLVTFWNIWLIIWLTNKIHETTQQYIKLPLPQKTYNVTTNVKIFTFRVFFSSCYLTFFLLWCAKVSISKISLANIWSAHKPF